MHRRVEQRDGAYALRQQGQAYNGDFGTKSEPLRLLQEEYHSGSGVSSGSTSSARNLAQDSTILVVEDEEAIVCLLENGLSQMGFRVLVAKDGLEAIDVYQRHRSEIELSS